MPSRTLGRMLTAPEVMKLTSVSRPTLYRWSAAGLFPPPLKLGPRRIAWSEADVLAWLRARRVSPV